MRLSSIAHLYRVRLKVRLVLVQELLAVLGLSVGVALLFASQVASASLNGSVQQLANELVGNMQYQLRVARSAGLRREPARAGAPPARCQRRGAGARGAGRGDRADGPASRRTDRRRSAPGAPQQSAVEALPLRPDRPPAGARAAGIRRRNGRRPAAGADRAAARREHRQRARRRLARHDRDRGAREQPGRGRAAGLRAEAHRDAGARHAHLRAGAAGPPSSRCGPACSDWRRTA